ncbi:MAG TPA: hypothetical protein EYP46_01405 [Hadesarchaea archaeon]|nr:hypothetical protein [Hadesarchaea archaeon]
MVFMLMAGSGGPVRAAEYPPHQKLPENYIRLWAHRDNNLNRIDDVIEQIIENAELVKHRKASFVISEENENVQGSFIVNFTRRINENDMENFFKMVGKSNVFKFQRVNAVSIRNVDPRLVENMSRLDGVEIIELQQRVHSLLDVSARAVKARPSIEYSGVWDEFGVDGAGVNIAILDTGVDDEHESLSGKYVAGVDCTGPTDLEFNPNDQSPHDVFHGTHAAGIAMGTGGAGEVYRGIAPGAGLIDVRVLNEKGEGTSESVIRGIEWCIANKDRYNIRILSMSLGSDFNSNGGDAQSQAVNAAVEAGIVVVAAAGNDGEDGYISSPGAADNAITVGALFDHNTVNQGDDTVASYSNRGPRLDDGDLDQSDELKPDLTAPGTYIWSAKGSNTTASNSYHQLSGTSMAVPHITGVVALMLQTNPNLTPSDVKQMLRETAEARGLPYDPGLSDKYNVGFGWGIVDARAAVQRALGEAGNPDFTISEEDISFSDNSPVEGQRVLITAAVHNLGNLDGTCDVAFYRQDTGVSFLRKVRGVSVKAGGVSEVKVPVTSPSPGVYGIFVKIENGNPSENNTVNNQASTKMSVGPRPTSPDLTLTEYDIYFGGRLATVRQIPPGLVKFSKPGHSSAQGIQTPLSRLRKNLAISARVQNVGETDAYCDLGFYVDSEIPENLIENFRGVSVPAAGENWFSVTWEVPEDIEGEHSIFLTIEDVLPGDDDPLNNKANKSISFPTTITTGDIAVAPDDITFSDNSPNAGEGVDIRVTVWNVGVVDVKNVKIAVYIDNVPTAVGTIPLIEQNSENSTSISWNAEEGSHQVGVLVTVEGMQESNYGNNTASAYISVGAADIFRRVILIAVILIGVVTSAGVLFFVRQRLS